ncbi:hypothetical protein MPER_09245 [Moniliophthora perniciosa FA553]|nr:hypothetical protein MPER_09245 [Moniliophthora perniciosa FA553]
MPSTAQKEKSKAKKRKSEPLSNKKSKKKSRKDDSSTSGSISDEEGTKGKRKSSAAGKFSVSWKDQMNSSALVASILENAAIKQKLYPDPGSNASTQDGGGMKKTDAYWDLTTYALNDHPVYGPKIQEILDEKNAATARKMRAPWENAIKSRLHRMEGMVRKILIEMGQTGMGIKLEEIDMNAKSSVTNAGRPENISREGPWVL